MELARGRDPAQGEAAADWPELIRQLVQGLDRSSRQWTPARRKDSVQRVLAGSGRDAGRLHGRLSRLVGSWDSGAADAAVVDGDLDEAVGAPAEASSDAARVAAGAPGVAAAGTHAASAAVHAEPQAQDGARLIDEYAALARSLTDSLAALAESDRDLTGQVAALHQRLAAPPTARGLRGARALLADLQRRQRTLRQQRDQARQALQALLEAVLSEIGALDSGSRELPGRLAHYAQAIAQASSLGELGALTAEMAAAAQTLQALVAGAHARLSQQREQAQSLQQRVQDLEDELRRLDAEVSTDALTQVANRRGLQQAFDAAATQHGSPGAPPLAVALIDIDNFKRLNDGLGHAAGDAALQALAREVRQRLGPHDHLARFGGEEFVLLLPGRNAAEGQTELTRLQRALSAALFLHQGQEVFVTFSAGVTPWRCGESLDTALDRADTALYEAKRTGKNRTCVA